MANTAWSSNHRQADLSDKPTFFISNRLYWHAQGITRIRRHRCPVEVYAETKFPTEEGKAEGLDQYQLRGFGAIERHIALAPSSTVHCAPPNMTRLSKKSCNVNSRSSLKGAQPTGGELLRLMRCGVWLYSSAPV